MDLFPAIVIGGPPHAGKSVLVYALTEALRRRGVEHYTLRAHPDYEGDWAARIPQDRVRRIRVKGPFTPALTGRLCQDIASRMLPVLVDAGGKPTPDQEQRIFGQCTHMIVLSRDEASRQEWLDRAARLGLILLADVRSQLEGVGTLSESAPVIRGVLTSLERGSTVTGPVLDALVDALSRLCAYPDDRLRALHLAHAPADPLELNALGKMLGLGAGQITWKPADLPRVLNYLPRDTAHAIYDRGPNWLYAALALHAGKAALHQFDARLGWVAPPELCFGTPAPDAPLQAAVLQRGDHVRLEFSLREQHMDISEAPGACVPVIPPGVGVVLSGKLPLWLWTALARTYRGAPWIAIYNPGLEAQRDCALVVASAGAPPVGVLIDSAP